MTNEKKEGLNVLIENNTNVKYLINTDENIAAVLNELYATPVYSVFSNRNKRTEAFMETCIEVMNIPSYCLNTMTVGEFLRCLDFMITDVSSDDDFCPEIPSYLKLLGPIDFWAEILNDNYKTSPIIKKLYEIDIFKFIEYATKKATEKNRLTPLTEDDEVKRFMQDNKENPESYGEYITTLYKKVGTPWIPYRDKLADYETYILSCYHTMALVSYFLTLSAANPCIMEVNDFKNKYITKTANI